MGTAGALTTASAVLATAAGIGSSHAYIDPGSGSYFFQLLIGGLLGAGVALRLFWQRISGLFSRRRGGTEPGDAHPSAAPDEEA